MKKGERDALFGDGGNYVVIYGAEAKKHAGKTKIGITDRQGRSITLVCQNVALARALTDDLAAATSSSARDVFHEDLIRAVTAYKERNA